MSSSHTSLKTRGRSSSDVVLRCHRARLSCRQRLHSRRRLRLFETCSGSSDIPRRSLLPTEGSGDDNRDGFAAGLRCIGCISLSGEVRWPVCPERGRASSIPQWFAPAMLRTSTADSIALTSRVLCRVCCSFGLVTEPSSTLAVATRACMSD